MRDVIERLSAAGELPPADQLVGVPRAELDAWERELGIKLPIDYHSFMEAAGATADAKIFMGSGFFWPAPVGLRKLAQDSLDPEEYAVIPSDALIILEHQGHTFAWLDPTDPATTVYVSQPVDADVLAKSHDNTCALR